MNNILKIEKLNKEYSDFKLDNITFTVPKGYIMGFIGPNGAGKTTTIKLMLNMINKKSGDISIFDMDNIKNEMDIKQKIGAIFDDIFFVQDWNLNDVEKAVSPFYTKWSSKDYNYYLQKFSLIKHKKVKDLSRGMKMKLMIAVALSHKAELLILDEPTSGLDPLARDELLDILREYVINGDKSVLFSTHIITDLEKIADYITFINKGKIVYSGTRDSLEESYIIVKGGKNDLSSEQKKLVFGYREYSSGFEGLILKSNRLKLPSDLVTQVPSLEDIVIYISKGEIL